MDAPGAAAWLKLLGAQAVSSGRRTGWVEARCLLAPWRHEKGTDQNPSFGVRVEPGDGRVHCFSCGYSGRQTDLVLDLMALTRGQPFDGDLAAAFAAAQGAASLAPLALAEPEPEPADETPWPDWWLDSFKGAAMSEDALAYLKAREGGPIPLAITLRLDLRWDANRRRILFPLRDSEARFRGAHGRATIPAAKPKYLAYTMAGRITARDVWLGETHLEWDRPVVIVEGPFDLARVLQVYRNAVASCGAGAISAAKAKRLGLASRIVTLYDADKAGDQARYRAEGLFKGHHLEHAVLDAGDPGGTSPYALAELLESFVGLHDVSI